MNRIIKINNSKISRFWINYLCDFGMTLLVNMNERFEYENLSFVVSSRDIL